MRNTLGESAMVVLLPGFLQDEWVVGPRILRNLSVVYLSNPSIMIIRIQEKLFDFVVE